MAHAQKVVEINYLLFEVQLSRTLKLWERPCELHARAACPNVTRCSRGFHFPSEAGAAVLGVVIFGTVLR